MSSGPIAGVHGHLRGLILRDQYTVTSFFFILYVPGSSSSTSLWHLWLSVLLVCFQRTCANGRGRGGGPTLLVIIQVVLVWDPGSLSPEVYCCCRVVSHTAGSLPVPGASALCCPTGHQSPGMGVLWAWLGGPTVQVLTRPLQTLLDGLAPHCPGIHS